MLDEDGIAGQVAMDDRRVTGVQVTGSKQQKGLGLSGGSENTSVSSDTSILSTMA